MRARERACMCTHVREHVCGLRTPGWAGPVKPGFLSLESTVAVTGSFIFVQLGEAQMLSEPGKMSAPRRSPL